MEFPTNSIPRSSNAEAGLALICTCLPAFVAQFRHLESAVRYGSSARSRNPITAESNNKGEFAGSLAFGTSRTECGTDSALWSDEVELVGNAQGTSAQGSDDGGSHRGIMRKTEVTHVVTYAIEEEEDKKSCRSK